MNDATKARLKERRRALQAFQNVIRFAAHFRWQTIYRIRHPIEPR